MAVDLKYLREHYASLSDEALSEIDRADLVEAAQRCYAEEIARRERARPSIPETDSGDDDPRVDAGEPLDGDKPDWLDEAAEVYSRYDRPGAAPDDVADAREALEVAGIPCYLDLIEEAESGTSSPMHRWRVLVPGNLNLHATSVLERAIFNAEFEAGWRTHLETLSDEELREMTPEVALCGLFDRVERVTRAYQEEIARRNSHR
jgi:hypothetical protein